MRRSLKIVEVFVSLSVDRVEVEVGVMVVE
jgi:hypothetical protein